MTRLARALAALTLCLAPASVAGADTAPVCAPDRLTCGVSAATCTPDGAVCTRAHAGTCGREECTDVATAVAACGPAVGCQSLQYSPMGGIEKPAVGSITIRESPTSPAAMLLTGVFEPAAGQFDCTLSAPANAPRTARCVPLNGSYDWYCGGWILTATTHTYDSEVAGQASCSDHQGAPGTSNDRTLWTDTACCNQTERSTGVQLAWFVRDAIVCQAWGSSVGPKPTGDYTVTCNEPGAKAPGSS